MKKILALIFTSVALNFFAAGTSYADALNTFEAVFKKSAVSFKWVLTNEDHVTGVFTIEKSKDGKNFVKISEVKSTMNFAGEIEYMDIDAKPSKKKNYYRLKFTDHNGTQLYSRVVVVEKAKKPSLKVTVTKDEQGIEFSNFKKDEQVLIVIRDQSGNEFFSKSLVFENQKELVLDKELNLPAGEYQIIASSKNSLYSSSFKIP